MNAARVKALELALLAVQFGVPIKDAEDLLNVADLLRNYIEPPVQDLISADEGDYPRMQPSGFDAGSQTIPSRY
jgi:hypothetical protein